MLVDHHLLERYWAGLCTPLEREAVEQWMSEEIPEETYEFRTPEKEPIMKDQLWQRIAQFQNETLIKEPAKIKRLSIKNKLLALAAMLILIFGIGLYVAQNVTTNAALKEATLTYREIAIPYGEKAQVTLPDGTKVFLNAGSRLRYPPKFSDNKRLVLLEGEGFFEVTKDPNKPFFVKTRQTTTRVLGTRFNLQSWNGRSDMLNVEEGRVQFTAEGCTDTLLLHANMQGLFDGHSLTKIIVNSGNNVAWTKGIMIFNDVKLGEVTAELERWYAIRIKLSDPRLAENRVKAQFNNASLTDVLRDISFALNIKYTLKNKEVTLSR